MDAYPQSDSVLKLLRVGDLVGRRQQPEHQYEVLMVDKRYLLAAQFPELALRFIPLWDVVVPF